MCTHVSWLREWQDHGEWQRRARRVHGDPCNQAEDQEAPVGEHLMKPCPINAQCNRAQCSEIWDEVWGRLNDVGEWWLSRSFCTGHTVDGLAKGHLWEWSNREVQRHQQHLSSLNRLGVGPDTRTGELVQCSSTKGSNISVKMLWWENKCYLRCMADPALSGTSETIFPSRTLVLFSALGRQFSSHTIFFSLLMKVLS